VRHRSARFRTLTERQNEIIVEKAIRYSPRGIVGIDIAGPRPNSDGPYPYRTLHPLVQQARDAGLGVTIHVGEYGIAEIGEVVSRGARGVAAQRGQPPRARVELRGEGRVASTA
jgi:hypothetical protein